MQQAGAGAGAGAGGGCVPPSSSVIPSPSYAAQNPFTVAAAAVAQPACTCLALAVFTRHMSSRRRRRRRTCPPSNSRACTASRPPPLLLRGRRTPRAIAAAAARRRLFLSVLLLSSSTKIGCELQIAWGRRQEVEKTGGRGGGGEVECGQGEVTSEICVLWPTNETLPRTGGGRRRPRRRKQI